MFIVSRTHKDNEKNNEKMSEGDDKSIKERKRELPKVEGMRKSKQNAIDERDIIK